MATIRLHRDAEDLTFADNTSGGREIMHDLLARVAPTPADYVRDTFSGTNGRDLLSGITGASPGDRSYRSAQRNFQRYANGRTPKLDTLERYRLEYEQRTGKNNPALDRLIDIVSGKAPVAQLPPGDLKIEVKAKIAVTTGKKNRKQHSDVRTRSVTLDIPRARQGRAVADPMAEWTRQLEDAIPQFDIADIEWMEVSFTEKEA